MIKKTQRSDADFSDEIQAHLALEADALMAEGMSRTEAMAAARRAFGNVGRTQERFYESNRRMWLDHLVRDIRQAFRHLRSSPAPTAVILLSLALGIGLTTAIFSLADQALVRSLPVNEPHRLAQLEWQGEFVVAGMGNVGPGSVLPYPLFHVVRERSEELSVFDSLFARSAARVHLRAGERAEPVDVEVVTGSYFTTLGLAPSLGRLFADSDDAQPGAHPVLVLSHAYWQSRFGGDREVVGTQVRMNDQPMTVIGVAPAGFRGLDWSQEPALWLPMMMKEQTTPGWSGLEEHRTRFVHIYGRLARGVDHRRAATALEPSFSAYLQADVERESWPQVTPQRQQAYLAAQLAVLPGARGQAAMKRLIEKPLFILMAASGLIFLLVCLNVATLSLARALAGRRAIALHTALGASRGRIASQQLVESAILALIGCAAGAALAPAASRLILSFLSQSWSEGLGLRADLDLRVLAMALALAAVTVVVSGAAPAFYAASIRPSEALKRHASGSMGSAGLGYGWRRSLVIAQVALALVLLIGAGLMSSTLSSLRQQGVGFSTANLMMFRLTPTSDGYDVDAAKPVVRQLAAALEALPETQQVGVSAFELLQGGGWNNPVTLLDQSRIITTDRSIPMNAVSPEFFDTLGAPIVAGRSFDSRDINKEPGWHLSSAIVNRNFVDRYLSDTDPIGVRLGFGTDPGAQTTIEIVGVVDNFRDFDVRQPEPQIYFSLWQRTATDTTFYVRTQSSTEAATQAIQQTVERVDSALVVYGQRSFDAQLERRLGNERMLAVLAVTFALLATTLAMIGLYGVLAFSAAQRTKEIGIRISLGARHWSAGGLIVREALSLTAIGLALALPLAWLLGNLIKSQLYGISPMDPVVMLSASVLLAAVGVASSLGPAWRLAHVDPVKALRAECSADFDPRH